MPRCFRAASLRAVLATVAVASVGVLGLGAPSTDAAPAHAGVAAGSGAHSSAAATGGSTGPLLRIIQWSGYSWLVMPSMQPGPEHTLLTNAPDAVWVDSRGRLHMKIVRVNGQWRGVEMECLNQVGYGTYHWVVDTRTGRFARPVVLGMFVYRPGTKRLTNEIDVEDAKFAHVGKNNDAQYAVQPFYAPHHYIPYDISSAHAHIYQQFQWLPGSPNGVVHFVTRAGATSHGPLIRKWTYRGSSTPTTNNEHLFVDLWLNERQTPKNGTRSAIIRSIHFSPAG